MSWSLIGWKFRLNELQLRARAKIFVRTKLSTNQRPGNHVSIFVLYLRKYFAPLYRREAHKFRPKLVTFWNLTSLNLWPFLIIPNSECPETQNKHWKHWKSEFPAANLENPGGLKDLFIYNKIWPLPPLKIKNSSFLYHYQNENPKIDFFKYIFFS